ncbi:MAG: hypothetical protein AB7N80_06350 [Bdellovibrionales bacterium]
MATKQRDSSIPINWQDLYEHLQKAVVEGRHALCRDALKKQNPQKIPREWASRFADLAVRTHLPLFALKALHALVFSDNTLNKPATNLEFMTYARSLYHLGAVADAIQILNKVDIKAEPEVLFLRACANIFDWNYPAAISDLKAYLAAPDIAPYRRLVGKVNLAAAYINVGDWVEADEALAEVQYECEAGAYQLLLGNSLELRSQVEIFQGRFEKALVALERAQELLQTQGALYSLYVEKWKAVCHCLQRPSSENIQQLERVRQKANELGHWGTLRECDLFEAIANRDETLIRKVIMGTPSEFYRQRARRLFKTEIVFRGQYRWKIKGDAEGEEQTFDPYRKAPNQPALYEKPMLLSLFEALASDFYQPFNLSILFNKVYVGEKFNPFSSPARVLQLLRRLDRWFKENRIPLRVRFKKSEFCLKSITNVEVIVQRGKDLALLSPKKRQLMDLKLILKEKSLSVEKIRQRMGLSESSTRRLLRRGLVEGHIKKIGTGRGTVYQAASARQKRGRL